MTDIFVSSEEVKVIGGTANVNVEVDFGPQGERGNLFLVGYGDPNTITHSQTLQPLDFYINVQVNDEDYLFMYQYVNQGGVNTWVRVATLTTDKFSSIRRINFVDGKASSNVDFKVSNIVPESLLGALTESSFNIQCTFQNAENPIAHSISINPITLQAGTGDVTLPVGINAVEFSNGEWSGINGLHVLHFLITVV
jgi:hypothetical protein